MALLLPTKPCRIDETDVLELGVGGAEANAASLLAQLGHEVSFVSRVGHDPFGRRILTFLRDSGVDVSSVAIDEDRPTGLYFREWLADGERRVYYYRGGSAASALAPSDLDRVSFAGARVVLITGITAALSATCLATVNQAVKLARHAKAAVVLDPNYRAALWDPVTARRMLLPLIGKSDLLLMGHEDSMAIFGLQGESAMQAAAGLGAKLVVLKVGANGALALVDERSSRPLYGRRLIRTIRLAPEMHLTLVSLADGSTDCPSCRALNLAIFSERGQSNQSAITRYQQNC